jgi:tetratricopeptide (TPR) repeat protein
MLPAAAHAQTTGVEICGDPFRNHFGPYDFRFTTPQSREIVEKVHFTPGIESMTRPGTTMMHEMAGDVAYTLEVFPNHPRALVTMQRLAERHRADPPPGTRRTVECWFDRAVRFRPDDNVARVLYARWLHGKGRRDDAMAQVDEAARRAGENGLSHFNLGLLLVEMGNLERALQQAHRARALGMQSPDLENLLRRQNAWRDPAP